MYNLFTNDHIIILSVRDLLNVCNIVSEDNNFHSFCLTHIFVRSMR